MNLINHLSLDEVGEVLWCGIVAEFQQDLLNHSVTFSVKVIDNGESKLYKIRMNCVFRVIVTFDHPDQAWDYAELTEIEINQKEDVVIFSSELWSSGLIEIEAKSLELFSI